MSCTDIQHKLNANGRRERHRASSVLFRLCYRLGAYLCTSDRIYRVTIGRAKRRAGRCPKAFREYAIAATIGLVAQGIAIGGGFWYLYKAEQEYQRIAEQRRQQEQRQHELNRQSFFVRAVGGIVDIGEF